MKTKREVYVTVTGIDADVAVVLAAIVNLLEEKKQHDYSLSNPIQTANGRILQTLEAEISPSSDA